MTQKVIYLLIASAATWFLGVAAAFFYPDSFPSVFSIGTGLTLVTLSVFSFSFMFFGYLAPLMMFFAGGHAGIVSRSLPEFNPAVAALIVANFLAAYAAVRLGDALLEDLRGKGNVRNALAISLIIVAIAAVFSFSFDFFSTQAAAAGGSGTGGGGSGGAPSEVVRSLMSSIATQDFEGAKAYVTEPIKAQLDAQAQALRSTNITLPKANLTGFSVLEETVTGDTATVKAELTFTATVAGNTASTKQTKTFQLVREGGIWKVSSL